MTTHPILEVTGATSTASDGTSLLDDVSFSVEPGWLVAVVGPTGAGKSSLARALLGELPLSSGTVRVSGGNGFGRVAGVPQDDATHPQLSLRRTLEHAAALRVDASPTERRRRVDAVLAELGLTSRADTRLADLSGGERKRTNVAVELLGRPDLLVLDEPTSGLDPGFEKTVFASLRDLADAGRTIVAITHSVRVLAVCDRVLFLAPGGAVAFFGTPDEAAAYFEWDEPADAYDALGAEPASSLKERFAKHRASRQVSEPAPRPAAGGPGDWAGAPAWAREAAESGERWGRLQGSDLAVDAASTAGGGPGHLGTLLRRALHVASSDRRTMALTLLAGPVLGVLLLAVLPGGTLRPPTAGEPASKAATFAFFLAMTITWLGAAGAAREVVKERHILRRELGVGVSLSSYVSGKALFLTAMTAVQVIPLAGIALLRQQMPGAGPALGLALVEVMAVSLTVGAAAVATGLLVSSWASSSEKAMTALPVVLIAQLALAGPWAEQRGLVVDAMRQVIPAKWAGTAVAATVTGDAGSWWLAILVISSLVAVQLGAALGLLRRSAPSRATVAPATTTWMAASRPSAPAPATSRPSGLRFVPAGIAVVLALAAGAGALSRHSDTATATATATVALAPAPAPSAAPAAAPAAPAPAAPAASPAPAPAPVAPTPTTARAAAPAPAPAPRTPATAAPRAATPTTTARAAAPAPVAPPTTARPTPTTRPPAATANPLDPLGYTNYILQQILQPQRR